LKRQKLSQQKILKKGEKDYDEEICESRTYRILRTCDVSVAFY
jgi:hypothetical protein